MKYILVTIAALAMLAFAAPAQAAGWTDNPNVPNCSILGQLLNTDASNCEWVAVTGQSISGLDGGSYGPPPCPPKPPHA